MLSGLWTPPATSVRCSSPGVRNGAGMYASFRLQLENLINEWGLLRACQNQQEYSDRK
jgi:hypothetical protein